MGRRDDARLETQGARAAEALEAALLERPQQLPLERQLELADLVEEERAAPRELEAPDPRRRRRR